MREFGRAIIADGINFRAIRRQTEVAWKNRLRIANFGLRIDLNNPHSEIRNRVPVLRIRAPMHVKTTIQPGEALR
jgi:hypothetical protein